MNPLRIPASQRGFTLLELIVAMLGASVLMAGLSSVLFMALEVSERATSTSPATLDRWAAIAQVQTELQFAIAITEQQSSAITITVPDRDDPDTTPETIRFAWSGTPGDSLTRQYNGGVASAIAADVHDLQIDYFQPSGVTEYLNIRLQIGTDAANTIQSAIPLLNRP